MTTGSLFTLTLSAICLIGYLATEERSLFSVGLGLFLWAVLLIAAEAAAESTEGDDDNHGE